LSTAKVGEDNGKQNKKKKQRCEEVLSEEKSLSKDEKVKRE